MAELSADQKRTIVEALACFKRPAEVVVDMLEEHGVAMTIQQVVRYDPTKHSYTAGEDLREIFAATRKHYLEDTLSVPIANQGYRLKMLQDLLTKSIKAEKHTQAAAILEQAAKEVGGVLTNERNLNVDKKGGAMSELSPEERRAMVTEMLRAALDKKANEAPMITIEAKTDDEG